MDIYENQKICNEKFIEEKAKFTNFQHDAITKWLKESCGVTVPFKIEDSYNLDVRISFKLGEGEYDDEDVGINFYRKCKKDSEGHYTDEHFWETSLNFALISNCNLSNNKAVQYYIIIGRMFEHLKEIADIVTSYDFTSYTKASSDSYDANQAVKNYEQKKKDEEYKLKVDEAKNKLCVGLKVCVGEKRTWDYETKTSKSVPIYKTIEKIMPKTILFHEDYGSRTKIDELIWKISRGDWQFVEDEKRAEVA